MVRPVFGHAKLLLSAATNDEMKREALKLYLSAAEAGTTATQVASAIAVISNLPDNEALRKLALNYLEKASADGNGRAMRALASLRGTEEVYHQFQGRHRSQWRFHGLDVCCRNGAIGQ